MDYPITRFPDSLLLQKLWNIARKVSRERWQVVFNGENHQLFSLEARHDVVEPWNSNGVAKRLSESVGVTGSSMQLTADGRNIVHVTRHSGTSPFDTITINQGWFGTGDEAGRLLYIEASDIVGSELGVPGPKGGLPAGIDTELGRFVNTRDQGLARLEQMYGQFAKKLLEDREALNKEVQAKSRDLEQQAQEKQQALEQAFARKEADLKDREQELEAQIKKVDDRGAKHARRALRETIISELTKRDTTFALTKGTQRLRWRVGTILVIAGLLFTAGLVHNAFIASEVLAKAQNGWDWALTYFVAKQLTYTAGLVSVIWFGIRWTDRWFREHANEEFKAKTMQIDILRANWVIETLLEWERETIPSELVERLTHNLFRYPEESKGAPDSSGLASMLLGSAAKVKLNVGNGNEVELSRKGAQALGKTLVE